MSERLLKEFQERAEVLVSLPDVQELQRRGSMRRRARVAVGAVLVASALVGGGALVSTTLDQSSSIGPVDTGPTPPATGKDIHLHYLRPGSSHAFGPFDDIGSPATSGNVRVRFVVPSNFWYWRELGQGSDRILDHMFGGLSMADQRQGTPGSPYIRVAVTPVS